MPAIHTAIALTLLLALTSSVGSERYKDSTLPPFNLEITTTAQTSSVKPPSSLERAHWCPLKNGTYLPLGYTYMSAVCAVCQCTQSRAVRCGTFQCMPAYCIDNTTPARRDGQCCAQCAYENQSNSCMYSGVSFPHGAIVKTDKSMKCWCQLGSIECRRAASSGFDLFGDDSSIYIIVVVVCIVLVVGTLLCGGCAAFFYYHYQRNQNAEQVYDQYLNTAGWQPMDEQEQTEDKSAEAKQAEAEGQQNNQKYPTGNPNEYTPPPYAIYNGRYPSEQQ